MFCIDSHAHTHFLPAHTDYNNIPLLEYMAIERIDKASCIAMSPGQNRDMTDAVERYPDKLFGIAYVNVHDMDASIRELRSLVRSGVVRGIKLFPYLENFRPDDGFMNPLYETCLELDIPILFHTGSVTFSSWPSDAAEGRTRTLKFGNGRPEQYALALERYPRLKMIFAHAGGDMYAGFLPIVDRFENAYFDTAWLHYYIDRMLTPVTKQTWIERIVHTVGSQKLLFGGEGVVPGDVLACSLSREEKENILYKNAAGLYKLEY